MMQKWAGLVLAGSVLVGVAACSGGGGGPVLGGQGPAEPAPRTATKAASRAGGSGQPATGVSGQFCSFLATEVPRLQAKNSRVRAAAGFVVDYTRWVAQDRNRVVESASELDAISLASCPTVRREVLGVLDRDSLKKVLSR